jgi:signal peptidase I
MTIKGIGRSAREVFLTLGALLGVLCIVATIAGVAFGVKPLVFRSGSMSPAIHTGDLAVARTVDASDLKVGDIVSVVNAEGNRVTHRLVNVARQGNARQLTLKGDANKVADAEVYTVKKAERVLFDIPKAGYVVNAAASPGGVFVLGAYVTVMLLLVFRRKGPTDGDETPAPKRKGGARKADKKGARVSPRMIATTAVATSIAIATPAAAAPWTNDVVIGGGTFAAHVVPAPVVSCGLLAVGSARLNWTAVPGATSYVLHYGTGGATSETVGGGVTTKLFSGLVTSGTFTVEAKINYGSATWTSATSNSKNYAVLLFLVATCS